MVIIDTHFKKATPKSLLYNFNDAQIEAHVVIFDNA